MTAPADYEPTVADVAARLRAAAETLRQDGWVRGFARLPGAGCCAAGAVLYCDAPLPDSTIYSFNSDRLVDDAVADATLTALHGYLVTHRGETGWYGFRWLSKSEAITGWNDRDARDAEHVIETLDAAAAWVEARGRYELTEQEMADHDD